MPDNRQKSLVAAILAVHTGIVSPDEAAAALKDPDAASSLAPFGDMSKSTVRLGDDEKIAEHSIAEVLDDPEKQRQALERIGIGEDARQTLFDFGGNGRDHMHVIADTLRQVAGAGQRLKDSEIHPGTDPEFGSESPTQAPRDDKSALRLTTAAFFANFGVGNERYEIKNEHARGGMGRIMIAKDKAVGREIALKELLPGITGTSSIPGSIPHTSGSQGIEERFLREAKITGQLEHPNIVPVYEIGKHEDGGIYYTMRFVRGQTLNDRLREIKKDSRLGKPEKLAARIQLLDPFIDVCHAIAYAHSKNVVHRDIKPENIMLGDFGETQVLDWGLARIKGQEDKALRDLQKGSLRLSQSLYQSDSQTLTMDGSIVGTPAYMSPEQARGELENVDEQSDVYSLGAVLYQILTGHAPFEGPMAALIVQQVLNGPPMRVRARQKEIPPELEALVECAMAREKKDRLNGALALAGEVKAFRDGRTLGSYTYSAAEMVKRFFKQNRTPVSVAILGFLLLVAGAIFFMQQLTIERNEAMNAKSDADNKRVIAEDALATASRERAERDRLEKEKRQQAQRVMDLRVEEARKLLDTISGIRIEPALADMEGRLALYELEMQGPPQKSFLELPVDEQIRNSVLLSSVLGYVSARQNLVDLLDTRQGVTLPADLRAVDVESYRLELIKVRVDTSRLATINGDFQLALLLLADDSVPSDVESAGIRKIEHARAELLSLHRKRISEALADVELGLAREGRDEDAPNLHDYVRRLSTYRERQTVDVLGVELQRLMARGVETWKRSQFNVSVLAVEVLGHCEQPVHAIPALVEFLQWAQRPELVSAASRALCATRSAEAFEPLMKQIDKRGLDYLREIESDFANVPMPAHVRDPQTVRDHIDRSIALRARGNAFEAEAAATRALNIDEMSALALLHRALAHADLGSHQDAQRDLTAGMSLATDDLKYELLLARGMLRDAIREHELVVGAFTEAIQLRPDNHRAYAHRAETYADYYRYELSFADYEQALRLESECIETCIAYAKTLAAAGGANSQRALNYFATITSKWPQDWRGWSAEAVVRREYGLGRGMAAAEVAVKLNPQDSASWSVLTQEYFAYSRFRDGIDAAKKAVEANPQEWLAFYYQGLHYFQMQKHNDGQQLAAMTGQNQEALNSFPELRRSNLQAAADSFYSALKIEPSDFRTSMLLSDTLMQLGRYEDARKVCSDALTLSPFSYMRWGGAPAPEVLFTHDALKYLRLLNSNTTALNERLHKVLLLSAIGGAGEYNVFPRVNEGHFREAVRQMDECWNLLQAGESTPQQEALYAYAQDRLLSALMTGYGRAYYAEALVLCERRLEIGRFLDEGFYFNLMNAHLGMARGYREKNHAALGLNDEDRAALETRVAGMTEAERTRLADEHLEAAGLAFEKAVDHGFREWPWLWDRSVLGDIQEYARYEEIAAKMSSPAQVESESLYDETMLIVHVLEGGPAWQGGIRQHDNVAMVNDVRVYSTTDFIAAWRPIPEGEMTTLTVRRYFTQDGFMVPKRDESGEVIHDENGFVMWDYNEFEVKIKRGFLGVNLGGGFLPPRFER